MKLRAILFLVVFSMLFAIVGCDDNEETTNNNPGVFPTALVGTWDHSLNVEQTGTSTFTPQLTTTNFAASLVIQANGNWVHSGLQNNVPIRETGHSRWIGTNTLRVYFDTVQVGSGNQVGDSMSFTCVYTNEWMSLTSPRDDQPQWNEIEVWMKRNATTGSLVGLARDGAGLPVQGAVISLDTPTDTPTPRDTTDQYGFFSIGGLNPGMYPVIATHNSVNRNGTATITAGGLAMLTFTFTPAAGNGTVSGTVRDVNTESPLANVTITADNNATTMTDASGNYSFSVPNGLRVVTASLNTFFPSVAAVFVSENQTTPQDFYLAATSATPGMIQGTVLNATNNNPISGATVQVSGGQSATTDASGNYTITLDAGTRAIFASMSGFYTSNVTILRVQSSQTVTQNFSLAPEFVSGSGRIRLVLSWGQTPNDLDSHLLTPGGGHVAYYARGDSTSSPYAVLDVDDVSGFGPETITIYQFQTGTYKYFIHNYSGSPDITTSTALAQIYDDNGLVSQLNIPTSPVNGSRYWYVCDINGATRQITIQNQLLSSPPTIAQDWIWAHPKN